MGKTTAAVALAREFFGETWQMNFRELNASDERGIDVVRNQIKEFARTSPLGGAEFKILFLDEADALTTDAQAALRRTMETYARTCRFVLSCNYSSKIIDPIQSRCAIYRFRPLTQAAIGEEVRRIAEAEKLTVTDGAIEAIAYVAQGDMRRAINALQGAAMVSDAVDESMVYATTATARPDEIKELLHLVVAGEFEAAEGALRGLMYERGIAPGESARPVLPGAHPAAHAPRAQGRADRAPRRGRLPPLRGRDPRAPDGGPARQVRPLGEPVPMKGAAMSTGDEPETTNRVGDWGRFLKLKYKNELGDLVRQYPKKRSLYIDYRDVYAFGKPGVRMAQELIENPGKVLEDVRDAVRAQQLARGKGAKDPEVNIRFTNLPVRLGARDIRSEHINRFVSVEGILRKTTEVRPRIVEAVFRCPGGHLTRKAQEFGMFVEPDGCATEGCTYRKLTLVPKRSSFVDAQKLRIQESPEGLRGGEQPQTIDVDVTDDIAGTVAPGDRVVINGILRSQQRVNHGNKSTFFDIHLEANSIEVGEKEFEEVSISDKDEEEIQRLSNDPEVYKKIMRSIAPTIYGNEEVKEAIALQLFGGIMKSMPDGSHLRGDIHCLLIGDPGIAKSQILRYVVRLSPRGIYTSGQSSTQAGLTATAVKDEFGDGRWTLEAGALVLADMGIAAVDEMDKMQKDDRSALHEAMEQQSISVAKAGITATLKSRCALLGAANPKLGRFDEYADIGEQINMPPSLLSRFDLIFILADKPDHKRDEAIAEHILKAHGVGELIAQHAKDPIEGVDDEYIQRELAPVTPEIEPAMLRKYVAYAKRTCFPILSPEAKDVLVGYYMRLRDLADSNKPVPVTARQLEALVRLAEASARVRLAKKITADDAERVVRIVDTCLRQVAYDPKTGTFDIDKVATGISKGKRDLIRAIKESIRENADVSGRAQIAQIVDVLVQQGFGREDVRKQIDNFLRSGEAMEPKNGVIKLI